MNESGTMSDELRRRDRPVSEKKIVVPEGMLEAAIPTYLNDAPLVRSILKAALRWMLEQ